MAIDQTISLCRNLYNSALEHRIYLYKHGGINVNYYDQANERKAIKLDLPEYKTVHSQVLQEVGIDMGIKEFCITSDGELKPNPKHYRETEAKLKKQQRLVSRKKKGSNRRKKAI
ncbi:MAG: transposase [Desulfosporosinus sp.]|nr:transposase [Desulfosporosinus sp.]